MNPYLEKLIRLYLQAETDIISEIVRARALGNADFHLEASLERVQKTLKTLCANCWNYVPKMIEREFYVAHPELRRPEMYLTPKESLIAYQNALALSSEQVYFVQRLTMNLMKQIEDASETVMSSLRVMMGFDNYPLGRRDPDIFRAAQNQNVAYNRVKGRMDINKMVTHLQENGIPAFYDKSGRAWQLHTYCSMATRTTDRQATNLAVVTKYDDLYTIVGDPVCCSVCAALQGRVYSKSGADPDFPPLAEAFGKIDELGPTTLDNSWLNIHPNCRCSIIPWTKAGKSMEEIERMKRFSSFTNNPKDRDPRTDAQIKAYQKAQNGREKYLRDLHQWERYRETIPDKVPKTFETWMKHKRLDDEKYRSWLKDYRAENRRLKDEASDPEPPD